MKNRVFGYIAFLLALCGLLLSVVACSETSTAGGTTDENAVTEVSADEKEIMESKVDSIKSLVQAEPADIGDSKIDSTDHWYEVTFPDVGDDYFTIEEYDPLFACYVRVHRQDFGVQFIKSVVNVGEYLQTFFMTASEDGVTYHTKLDNCNDVANCEKDLADFESSCESGGGTLYRHFVDCKTGELHLTCSTFKGHLSDKVADILDTNAQKMKQWCMEGK